MQGERNCFRALESVLAQASGSDAEQIRKLVRRYQGRKALRHLFRVTCGMESMVIGEDEILGQVRDAYRIMPKKKEAPAMNSTAFFRRHFLVPNGSKQRP